MLTALLSWTIIGLVTGVVTSIEMKGGYYRVVGDIIVGIVGALLAGYLMSLIGLNPSENITYSIIVAFIGACILIAVLRAISRGTRRT